MLILQIFKILKNKKRKFIFLLSKDSDKFTLSSLCLSLTHPQFLLKILHNNVNIPYAKKRLVAE